MKFQDLQLIEPILAALKTEGYEQPTPIQAKAIPHILEGRDLLGCAQTGTGKTAAFAIPIIQLLHEKKKTTHARSLIKGLIVTPTRELAIQIADNFSTYGKHTQIKTAVIFGGVSQYAQVQTLQRGVDVLIATPGRLLDLMNQGIITLQHIEFFVLDEADRMLDMGFVHDVKKLIAKLPIKRQSLFFSATMQPSIVELARKILSNPVQVEVTPPASTVKKISQVLYYIDKDNKKLLLRDILEDSTIERALVFTRTKHGADKVAKDLCNHGIVAQAIHGNKSQNARQNALTNFKSKQTRILVATDIAARGIDIDELTHVINYEVPNIPESYVHRIGRTGRAGALGVAIAFSDAEEKEYIRDIQKLIGESIPVIDNHEYPMKQFDIPKKTKQSSRQGKQSSNSQAFGSNSHQQKSNKSRNYYSSTTSKNVATSKSFSKN